MRFEQNPREIGQAQLNFSLQFQVSIYQFTGLQTVVIGGQQIVLDQMIGYYQDPSDIAIRIARNITDNGVECAVNASDYFYQRRFSPVFTEGTTFYSNDYYLCKTIGAIPGKTYNTDGNFKITFDYNMSIYPAKQINVISSDIFVPTKEKTYKYESGTLNTTIKDISLLCQTSRSFQWGDIIEIENFQELQYNTAVFQGFTVQITDEQYYPIPIAENQIMRSSYSFKIIPQPPDITQIQGPKKETPKPQKTAREIELAAQLKIAKQNRMQRQQQQKVKKLRKTARDIFEARRQRQEQHNQDLKVLQSQLSAIRRDIQNIRKKFRKDEDDDSDGSDDNKPPPPEMGAAGVRLVDEEIQAQEEEMIKQEQEAQTELVELQMREQEIQTEIEEQEIIYTEQDQQIQEAEDEQFWRAQQELGINEEEAYEIWQGEMEGIAKEGHKEVLTEEDVYQQYRRGEIDQEDAEQMIQMIRQNEKMPEPEEIQEKEDAEATPRQEDKGRQQLIKAGKRYYETKAPKQHEKIKQKSEEEQEEEYYRRGLRIKEKAEQWGKANKEDLKQYRKNWRKDHEEHYKQYQKQYREEHEDEIKLDQKQRREAKKLEKQYGEGEKPQKVERADTDDEQ